jgi:hypothetical protein
MIDPRSMVPSLHDLRSEVFDEKSRYRGLPLLTWVDEAGVEHTYVAHRRVPAPETLAVAGVVAVHEGDRLDQIAAVQYGEAVLWWRIADANRALSPAELTERLGRRLLITFAEGTPSPRR